MLPYSPRDHTMKALKAFILSALVVALIVYFLADDVVMSLAGLAWLRIFP